MVIALARYGSGAYNVFKTLHILAAVIGMGGFLVGSFFGARARRYTGAQAQAVYESFAFVLTRIAEPALWLTFLLGFAVIGTSDKLVKMSESWVGIAMLLALIAIAVIRFVVAKGVNELTRDAASEAAQKRVAAASGVTHLLLVVVLILMVFKPGG